MIRLLIFLYIILTPFYIFESGNIQPSHALILILFFYYIVFINKLKINIYKNKHEKKALIFVVLFTVYVVIVNTIVSLYTDSIGSMKYTLYYLFNLIVFFLFSSLFLYKKVTISYIYVFLAITLVSQAVLLVFGVGRTWHGYQYILFFNNPHQLGYFSLLTSSLLLMISVYKKISPQYVIPIIIVASYLSFSALSIASFISIIVSLSFYVLHLMKRRSKFFISTFFVFLFLSLLYGERVIIELSSNNSYVSITSKLTTKTDRDGGWAAGRGYDTLFKEPQYLIFGMGELPGRFHNEFHSILGNVLRSYGVVGLFLLLSFGYFIFKNKPLFCIYLFIPVLIYGLAHNGIRQPLLWIYLALVLSLPKTNSNPKK